MIKINAKKTGTKIAGPGTEEKQIYYPIGTQTFSEVIKRNFAYVDKTDLIFKMVREGKYYFLSRPRRFGKSLLLTTLKAYFEGKKPLFKGLALEKLQPGKWPAHPIFHIDLGGREYDKVDSLEKMLDPMFYEWEQKYGRGKVEKDFGARFKGLVKRAFIKEKQPVVILVDEYDKPLTDAIDNPDLEKEFASILSGVYGVLKSQDEYIRFAMLTGVSRYGKMKLLSDTNNPKDISQSPGYSTVCGITEKELKVNFDPGVAALAEAIGKSQEETYEILRQKYDGYHFFPGSEGVYNPFSLLNALDQQNVANYWFSTATPTFVTKILRQSDDGLSMLENDFSIKPSRLNVFGNGDWNVKAVLYQSGYLTIKGGDMENYVLGLPNREVRDGLFENLIPSYLGIDVGAIDRPLIDLKKALGEGDADFAMEILQSVLANLPYDDKEPKRLEAYYRNMVCALMMAAGGNSIPERTASNGRMDFCVEKGEYVYVLEFKLAGPAGKALAQIETRGYARPFKFSGKKVMKIGVTIDAPSRTIKDWTIA